MAKYKAPTADSIRERWTGLFDAINHAEDLVCVVVATSYLDHTLAALLQAHFIDSSIVEKLLKPCGALGELMAKADLAYCLGLITKHDRQNVETIAQIRNRFAHLIDDISFADPEVERLCDELDSPLLTAPPFAELATIKEGGIRHKDRTRVRFRFTAVHLCSAFSIAGLSAKKCGTLTRVCDPTPTYNSTGFGYGALPLVVEDVEIPPT